MKPISILKFLSVVLVTIMFAANLYADNVTDDENMTSHFVDAYLVVKDIQNRTDQEVANAASSSDAKRMQYEAENRETRAIQNAGLTIDQYNQFIDRISKDAKYKDKIRRLLGQARAKQYGGG